MSEENVWTIDELVSLTTDVQTANINYRGKDLNFQFCELEEQEEPKLKWLSEDASDDDRAVWAAEIGTERVKLMIDKANTLNPDGTTVTGESWKSLPATLRYQITAEILQVESDAEASVTTG